MRVNVCQGSGTYICTCASVPLFFSFTPFLKISLPRRQGPVTSFSIPRQVKMAIQRMWETAFLAQLHFHQLSRHYNHISGQSWWSRFNLDQWLLFKVISGHIRSPFFTYDFLKRDREMQMVSLCLACQDASLDMHTNILRSPLDLNVT